MGVESSILEYSNPIFRVQPYCIWILVDCNLEQICASRWTQKIASKLIDILGGG